MNDIAPTRFKWVGTRPIRPDGVPKVTGRAMYGADFATAGTLYGKIIRTTTKVKAHDENGEAGIGDRVSLMETRPLSATKRWRLVEILERAK